MICNQIAPLINKKARTYDNIRISCPITNLNSPVNPDCYGCMHTVSDSFRCLRVFTAQSRHCFIKKRFKLCRLILFKSMINCCKALKIPLGGKIITVIKGNLKLAVNCINAFCNYIFLAKKLRPPQSTDRLILHKSPDSFDFSLNYIIITVIQRLFNLIRLLKTATGKKAGCHSHY